ncbi:GDP dissociation inhibitor [Aspergillus ambiguus]|uniref:putative Rab geranylgeranyl transferase escort protein n=1 Tax=Aspergillus ambiguus TaxID=176160 RepID=UPI003CCE167C
MESLAETPWDVVISGTGLAQSLLALALSRSGKNILHVDRNPYYGGSEAAFSLEEAEDWASKVNQEPEHFPFEDVTVYTPEDNKRLSSSRAYSLTLSPQLIYARSQLLPTLISSKVYKQLEFLAVGSWWIHKTPASTTDNDTGTRGSLYRVPSSREDIFADDLISVKSKRTLMRFLRSIGKPSQEGEPSPEDDVPGIPLSEYLVSKFQVPDELHDPLLSLSLSQSSHHRTSAAYAVPRVKRHLSSIGVFGPGFGSLLAKWGGGSEISQVGCRALAVGGGIYVLNTGIKSVKPPGEDEAGSEAHSQVCLSNDVTVRSKYVVGSNWELPARDQPQCERVSRSITVISSPLESLFPVTAEGGPSPAGAVVVFPGNTLGQIDDAPPVYLLVHSSETGECPLGQSVVYGSVSIPGQEGQSLIEAAVSKLLESTTDADAEVLWSLRYTQLGRLHEACSKLTVHPNNILSFPAPSLDLAFDDSVLDTVKEAWQIVMGNEGADHEYMVFEDRENPEDEE